ncbi:MAG: 50S ribosomal protein L23 [Kiritimatiellae bacterium]|nr:50S ribosomal protein L23 [Kiritimatiellia bacterium]MBO7299347.1 50S ribosomal protein L23 [Kiritimatiellia bacterium]MBQ2281404.1 50S ribosomal protein L23 [Kiritimatiellia bacterium]MBQ8571548.1 50S ribosomal protein L23 [Kiritimatiellia bacterium]
MQKDVIKSVMSTEKALQNQESLNRYMLRVAKAANKIEIKKAVEELFNVSVVSVNTQNYEGKKRVLRNRKVTKAQDWKRAIVTLKKGDKIDLI